jgi:hypothetical protein
VQRSKGLKASRDQASSYDLHDDRLLFIVRSLDGPRNPTRRPVGEPGSSRPLDRVWLTARRATQDGVPDDIPQAFKAHCQREMLGDVGPGLRPEPPGELRIFGQPRHTLGHRVDIALIHEKPGGSIDYDFWNSAVPRGNSR